MKGRPFRECVFSSGPAIVSGLLACGVDPCGTCDTDSTGVGKVGEPFKLLLQFKSDDSYSRRNLLKPSWVTRIQESGNGPGRTKVAATFPRCMCGRDQEQCAVTKKRDRDAATLAVIEKVRVSAACFLLEPHAPPHAPFYLLPYSYAPFFRPLSFLCWQCLAHEERPDHDRGDDAMVDTNDKGTESDEDEEMLEAFSLSPKDLATPAAGVGLKHLLPTIADGSRASKALEEEALSWCR